MASVQIYGVPLSSPTRIVMMTCEVLGISYELIQTNPITGDTKTEMYLKMNPQHTIPLLVDGDIKINESRAAAAYLVNTYGADSDLYPSEPRLRAVIDQRLYFDMGTFYKAMFDCCLPILSDGQTEPSRKSLDRLEEVLCWVQDFLAPTGFVAGTDHLTLADISFIATFHSIIACDFFDYGAFFKDELKDWCIRVKKAIPNYETANHEGALAWGQYIKDKIEANK